MLEIFNSPWLYASVAFILLLVLLQTLIYMSRAWKRAQGLGIATADLRKTIIASISISFVPTLSVLLVFLLLTPLLGVPIPWLRLTVIGSAGYEAYAATIGAKCIGEELLPGAYTLKGLVAATWAMTVGGSAFVLWSSLAIKPVSALYEIIQKKMDLAFVLAIGGGILGGLCLILQ